MNTREYMELEVLKFEKYKEKFEKKGFELNVNFLGYYVRIGKIKVISSELEELYNFLIS